MDKQFYFLSGLPRSGSTVLASILNQNPSVYVTPTSPLLDLLIENQNSWYRTPSVKANPFPEQLTNLTRAMIQAMWQHQPEPIIIDKNRGWGKNMPASTILFEQEIKVIATVRDLPSIMASWLTLLKVNPSSYIHNSIVQRGFPTTDENLMAEMWFNMVKDCMEAMQQLKKDASNRLLLIDYNELVTDPAGQLSKISVFLQLPSYIYDFNNIICNTVDDDLSAWGLNGMHKIRSTLSNTAKNSRQILGDDLYSRFIDLEKDFQ